MVAMIKAGVVHIRQENPEIWSYGDGSMCRFRLDLAYYPIIVPIPVVLLPLVIYPTYPYYLHLPHV